MPQHQDFLMRFIERLSQALGDILNRLLKGEGVELTVVDADLNGVAYKAGMDLELAQRMAPDGLLGMVSTGGVLDTRRCWVLAELLYLNGLKCEQAQDLNRAVESYERSILLYSKVRSEKDDLCGLPAPSDRMGEIKDRTARLNDGSRTL